MIQKTNESFAHAAPTAAPAASTEPVLLLSLDSSSVAASACLTKGGDVLAHSYQNVGLTHSRTLLPMVERMLLSCDRSPTDMEAIAVSHGPGSFTGLRIGLATVKGLAFASGLPCLGVSTLLAAAFPAAGLCETILAVMDARAGQVYHAFFDGQDPARRLTEDAPIALADLFEQEIFQKKSILLVGDGAKLCYNEGRKRGLSLTLAPFHLRFQSALGVSLAAERLVENGAAFGPAEALRPVYLRLPQAERERQKKENTKENNNV